jgi:hypothetical protein
MTIRAHKITLVAACVALTVVVLPNTGASARVGGVAGVSGVSGVGAAPHHGGAHGVVRSHPGAGRGTVHRGGRRPRTAPTRR